MITYVVFVTNIHVYVYIKEDNFYSEIENNNKQSPLVHITQGKIGPLTR